MLAASTILGIDSPFFSTIGLSNTGRFPWVSGGFVEGRILERMGKVPLELWLILRSEAFLWMLSIEGRVATQRPLIGARLICSLCQVAQASLVER